VWPSAVLKHKEMTKSLVGAGIPVAKNKAESNDPYFSAMEALLNEVEETIQQWVDTDVDHDSMKIIQLL